MNICDIFLAISPKSVGRQELDTTGKILLPETFLNRILRSNPNHSFMTFVLTNPQSNQQIAAGVESFTADNSSVVIPSWMMHFIDVSENDKVRVTFTKLPNVTFVSLQSFQSEFLSLPNYTVILECALRQFPCLTQGSVIPIPFVNSIYYIKILKIEPQRMGSAVHVDVSTDIVAQSLDSFTHHWGEEEDHYEPAKQEDSVKSVFQGPSHKVTLQKK